MRCPRCQRIQSPTTKADPETCRAHLATFVDVARAADNRIDCWRTQMHAKALRFGLSAQVALVNRLIIDEDAPFRPIVVVVPHVPDVGDSGQMWARPTVEMFDVRMFTHVGEREYVDGFRATPEYQEQMLVDKIDGMLESLAVVVARDGVRWAS